MLSNVHRNRRASNYIGFQSTLLLIVDTGTDGRYEIHGEDTTIRTTGKSIAETLLSRSQRSPGKTEIIPVKAAHCKSRVICVLGSLPILIRQ